MLPHTLNLDRENTMYRIVQANTPEELEEKVCKLMQFNPSLPAVPLWKPQGGVSVVSESYTDVEYGETINKTQLIYTQAMVRC